MQTRRHTEAKTRSTCRMSTDAQIQTGTDMQTRRCGDAAEGAAADADADLRAHSVGAHARAP
eukprot:5108513-Alexandrium_andersonii.AAC.1